MKPIVIEVVARIVDGVVDPEPMGSITVTDPRDVPARMARLLRALADQLDEPSAPQRLGSLLPAVVRDLTSRRGSAS